MRRYLHFITKPYSLSVIQALVEEIERGHWGDSLIFLPPVLKKYIRNDMHYTTSIEEAGSFDPDVVFVPGNVVHDKIPGLKVQVFHGICEEKGGHYKITGFFDLYCTSGPLITRKFKSLAAKHGYFHVIETGWAKVDLLMNPYNRAEILMKLGVRPENRIILYAPTFSPKYKSSGKLFPALQSMIKRDETWIIKFHDLMDKEEVLRFKKLDNVLVWDDPDNIPLLQAADVLISDTSSIVYEFMLLDKPVITIDARIRLEKGINIQDVRDLRTAIDRSVSNPEKYSVNRKNVLREIQPYADQANAKRVLEAAETMLTSDISTKLSKKPRNLYRKYRARKLLNNWW